VTFEVVPGFRRTDGSYFYPDANNGGQWRITHPRAEIQAMRTRNNACNSNLVRLFETLCFQNGLGGRRGKERDQRSSGVSLTAAGNDARGELGVVLNR
jgi:hypothetical protein